ADAPRRSQAAGNVQRRELPAVQQKSMAAARGIHEISDHIATGVDAPRRRRCRVRVLDPFIAVGRGRSRRRSVERRVACSEGGSLDVFRTTAGEQRGGCDGCGGESCSRVSAHGGSPYETLRVFLRIKSIRMNCPSVIVLVKYALPRQIALTFFTNSTRLRSRASMKVLIMIPERRHSATSR